MNKLILLFGVALCLVVVNARHFGDLNEEALENEEETLRRPKEHSNSQTRHRKRRWQSSYGYDYPPPSYPYADRREYDINRSTQELQHIARLLEEISAYIRRPPPPPPPPQPIYIPYPMYINYPQIPRIPCETQNKTGGENLPEVGTRRKPEDNNQNWGLVVSNENDYDDGSDGSRPISFDPIVPKQFMKRPSPKVDHGSVQASAQAPQVTTKAPSFQEDGSSRVAVPGMCNAATLSCCGVSQAEQNQCFSSMGCSTAFADANICSSQSIQRALQSFQAAYAPVQ